MPLRLPSQAFGDVFWRMLCDEFVARVAVPHVRQHAEDAEAASALIESAQDLEAFAENLSFVDGSGESRAGPGAQHAAPPLYIALEARRMPRPTPAR